MTQRRDSEPSVCDCQAGVWRRAVPHDRTHTSPYVSLRLCSGLHLTLLSVPLLPDNSDLIACTVVAKDGGMLQRFLAVDIYQMSLVEPDVSRLGWGVVKFAGLLQVRWLRSLEALLHWLCKHPPKCHLYSPVLMT